MHSQARLVGTSTNNLSNTRTSQGERKQITGSNHFDWFLQGYLTSFVPRPGKDQTVRQRNNNNELPDEEAGLVVTQAQTVALVTTADGPNVARF